MLRNKELQGYDERVEMIYWMPVDKAFIPTVYEVSIIIAECLLGEMEVTHPGNLLEGAYAL